MFVVWVTVGDDCGLSFIWCRSCHLKIVLLFVTVSIFFVPHFVVSAWCSRCTKHMVPNSDVFQ